MALSNIHLGADPYLTFHGFDESCRRVGHPEDEPSPPADSGKVRTFLYACSLYAQEMEVQKLKVTAGRGGL